MHILSWYHLYWAILPVLIKFQNLHPQLQFACDLTPPGKNITVIDGLLCLLNEHFFSHLTQHLESSKPFREGVDPALI